MTEMQTFIWSVAGCLFIFTMWLFSNANLFQNWKAYIHSLLKTERPGQRNDETENITCLQILLERKKLYNFLSRKSVRLYKAMIA